MSAVFSSANVNRDIVTSHKLTHFSAPQPIFNNPEYSSVIDQCCCNMDTQQLNQKGLYLYDLIKVYRTKCQTTKSLNVYKKRE